MSKQRKGRLTPRGWLRLLFGQPPAGMYRRPAVYMTGSQMEILSLTAHRITLRGRFVRTDFSDDV